MRVLVRSELQRRRGFEFALREGALAVCGGGELDAHFHQNKYIFCSSGYAVVNSINRWFES